MSAITPLQALRRLVDVARLIDADECPNLYNQIQAELAVAGSVLAEPRQEPVSYLRFRAAQQWSGIGGHDIEHAEWLETCQQHEIGDDKLPAFPVWTYPFSPEPVAAEPVKKADDFAHFLSYSGLSGEPADVMEKMRRAFEAGQPAETQQPVAWRVSGNFTDLPFKNESSADAYMSGLLANDPNGGYKKLPLFAAPLPEAGSVAQDARDAAYWRTFERALRTGHIPGPAHGRRFKIIETCPMYGEEKEFNDFVGTIAAMALEKK